MSNCPAIVISRGLYAAFAEHCLYVIKFKHRLHNHLFVVQLIASTTWHFDAKNPTQSYFQKKVGDKLVRFPINDCIVQRVDGGRPTIVCDNYIQGLHIGLGIVPSDMECYTAFVQQATVNDEDLLARKRENQRREKKIVSASKQESVHQATIKIIEENGLVKESSMDANNKKAYNILKTQGEKAAVDFMFKHPETGKKMTYGEMRSFYG